MVVVGDGADLRGEKRTARPQSADQARVQGTELLRERRGALITEFDRLGASVLQSMNRLDGEVLGASQLLGLAIADEGREPFDSAGSPQRRASS